MYGYATPFWCHFHVVFDVRVLYLNLSDRHFKSSRRELANVRIKRLTSFVKRHNEMLIVYIFLMCSPNSSYCELLFDTKTFYILSLWKRLSCGSGHVFFQFRPEPELWKIWVPAGTNRPEPSSGAPLNCVSYCWFAEKMKMVPCKNGVTAYTCKY
jgi:hypothetical protein